MTLFASLANFCFSQVRSDIERLRAIVDGKAQAEVIIANPGVTAIGRLTRLVSISSVTNKDVHIMLSPLTVEVFISEGIDFQIVDRDETKGLESSRSMAEAMEWDSYPSYPQYDSIMRFFASTYPELCLLDTIGTSVNGRLVLVLKISDRCTDDEAEPEVFYTSTMHGNETGGFILMLRLADYLLSNYPSDSRVRNLVDNLEIWINPLANPDGTYNSGDIIVSPVRNNADGYDLNRNFPDPNSEFVIRQKETLDMMEFMKNRKFILSANFHSGQEVLNYPWDRWSFRHADDEWFYSICRAWADTAHVYSRAGYMDFLDNGVTKGYDWYPVYGGRQDYVTYSLYGREVTIELDMNFITPSADLPDLWEFNRRSLLGYLENALYGIHGKVTDKTTGKPVYAKITIEGYDKDNSHIYSDSLTGDFVRLLAPGLYDLNFSAKDYVGKTAGNVSVSGGTQTNLFVELIPFPESIDNLKSDRPVIFPNPADSFAWVVLPDDMAGIVNISIYSVTGIRVADFDTEVSKELPVYMDLSRLPSGTFFAVFSAKGRNLSYKGTLVIVR